MLILLPVNYLAIIVPFWFRMFNWSKTIKYSGAYIQEGVEDKAGPLLIKKDVTQSQTNQPECRGEPFP